MVDTNLSITEIKISELYRDNVRD